MFDTEEEAAQAYQMKARRFQRGVNDDSVTSEDPVGYIRDEPSLKRPRVSSSSSTLSQQTVSMSQGDVLSSLQAKLMWERLVSIYQRTLLAKAVAEKMSQSQTTTPNQHRESLLKSLGEEIVMLGVVKDQLEEAVTRYFIREVSLQDMKDTQVDHMMFDIPLDPVDSAVFPLSHLTTPLHSLSPDDGQKKSIISKVSEATLSTDAGGILRTDTLYDVPTLPDHPDKVAPILSDISALTNVQSIDQCHSLLPNSFAADSRPTAAPHALTARNIVQSQQSSSSAKSQN